MENSNGRSPLPKATVVETLALIAEVFAPNVAKGVIIRRPRVVGMAERLGLDRRAVRRVQRLRDRYGRGPLMLRLPIRSQAVILDPDDVHRVLEESPEPFATASSEKRAALSHFEPKGALISHPPERTERRRLNEAVLESGNRLHTLASRFVAVAADETDALLREVQRDGGSLSWDAFAPAWFRIVRRVVFGDAARDDHDLTDMIASLRRDANWAMFRPKRKRLRNRFFARMRDYLARAEPGSLAAVMASRPAGPDAAPAHQVPQWLFAFDPAGMATFRTLALLATHPEAAATAREEIRAARADGTHELPYLRACVLEALRLWPTTPMVLRQTTRETRWEAGVMPEGTGVLIFAPFFHRDDARLAFADRLTPDLWLQERTRADWPLIPFSGGPGICPGRHLVLLLASHVLAMLMDGRRVDLADPRLDPAERLPATLDNYSLRFRIGA